MDAVKSPSLLSFAVAPGSLNVSPICRFIGLAPLRVMTGGIVSALVASLTIILRDAVAVLPSESVTL